MAAPLERRAQRVPDQRRALDARRELAHAGEHLEFADTGRLDVAATRHQVVEAGVDRVDLVWDPPWEPSMMSEAAKLELGMM